MKYSLLLLIITLQAMTAVAQKQAPCQSPYLPIVFVHGFLASGDTWATQAQRFMQNGYCNHQLFAYDWNTSGAGGNKTKVLDSFIAVVLKKTGASKVNLVGHSAGGGLCYQYCNDSLNARNISRYVHIASMQAQKAAGHQAQIPTLNITSKADAVAASAGKTIPDALNVQFINYDHLQVAASDSTFEAMYRFFNDATPLKKTAPPVNNPVLKGRAVYLGDNAPMADKKLVVYEWDNAKAQRSNNGVAVGSLQTDSLGYWGPFKATAGRYYELQLLTGETERKVNYFLEPFTQNDNLVYLRGFPSRGMTAMMLNALPISDQNILTIFTASQATVCNRDSLLVNDSLLSNCKLMPASKSAIASFLYDNGDSKSSFGKHSLMSNFPFMTAADFFSNPATNDIIRIRFGKRGFNIPARKAKTEGVSVVVFR
jgi:triacylglycerol lipase